MSLRPIFVLLSVVNALACHAEDLSSRPNDGALAAKSAYCVTNVAKFRSLSGADFLAGCDFHLTGVVTLVDTNRDLMVLQDTSGAVALNFHPADQQLQAGQLVTLEGSNCCPLLASFPDYPYRAAGMDICTSFETPTDWGEYNLTRMRGYLHPDATGEYKFWIASDNSSELWLSTDANPSNIRKIASIPRFGYVSPHEWTRYPSQTSDPIVLKSGELYYIEALQEQTTVGENLSVAWQGPGLGRSVIDRRYLTPWDEARRPENRATNGVLREFWIHYPVGEIDGIAGPRPFESALTVKNVRVNVLGEADLPKPISIDPSQPLSVENSFRWVQVEGMLKFKACDENTALLELLDGHTLIQVRALCWSQEMCKQLTNAFLRVEGVCEGVRDEKENMMPWLIWCTKTNCVSFNESGLTNPVVLPRDQYSPLNVKNTPAVQGFFSTRGVVTFHDRVFGKNYISVQGDNSAVLVSTTNQSLEGQLQVGKNVELGGALDPGKNLPIITPLVVSQVGWRSMPLPIVQPPGVPFAPNSEGMWTELEGVVHSVNPNGTLSVIGRNGPVYFWMGDTSSNILAHKVDARLRARGVLMLSLLDTPLLLIPAQTFVDREEDAPQDPFQIDRSSIASLLSASTDLASGHRVRVEGQITYRDDDSFFVEDDSGGIRVQAKDASRANLGEIVELVAFPTKVGTALTLTQPIRRLVKSNEMIQASNLELGDALVARQKGTLIQVEASLLDLKTNGTLQILELQKQQRVFTASLPISEGILPEMVPGSRLRITGVCNDEIPASGGPEEKLAGTQSLSYLNILLRAPGDVTLLSGPPWWTWKRTAALVGLLLAILAVALLWVHLLQRRLEHQQLARLVFSQQVFGKLEEERRRIAVNLHDSLGQTLLVIKNHSILATQSAGQIPGIENRLSEISTATSQAIEEVRRITHGLRPYHLDRLGLTQAIRASINQSDDHASILFASRVEDIDGLFDKETEIHIYRIVQESITNIFKHSAATEATVVIKRKPTTVLISIRDNGKGFSPTKLSSQSHTLGFGLTGIGERIRILKGTIVIDSKPQGGTSLTVEVPFKTA